MEHKQPEIPRLVLRKNEVAAMLGVTPRTLQTWAKEEGFPKPFRMRGTVLYRAVDIEDWVASGHIEQDAER